MVAAPLEALALGNRRGIPDDVAHLRAAHPQAGWRAHANFGDLGAFWLHIHATLRSEAGALNAIVASLRSGDIDAADAPRRVVPAFNGFIQHLDAHHRIEDSAYFPRFRLLDARMERGFSLLEADHVAIDHALHDSVASARAMLAASASDAWRETLDDYGDRLTGLTWLLDRHLADEEDIVIPALLEHGERSLGA